MAQQQPAQGMAHMNSMAVPVTWTNAPMASQMVGHPQQQQQQQQQQHDTEMTSSDAAHLMGMAMPNQIQHQQQQHMAYVQHQQHMQHQPQVVHHPQAAQMHQQALQQQHAVMLQQQQQQHQPVVMAMSPPPPPPPLGTPSAPSFVAADDDRSENSNTSEMRGLLVENRHRTLADVANLLHSNDKGPFSERLRQVFAMLWLERLCQRSRTSVPRGRVYGSYASRCAKHGITVLNPASFGKLVRILYPGLRTRRLGVRGESKYHYVNFSLKEDADELDNDDSQVAATGMSPAVDGYSGQREGSVITNASTAVNPTTSVAGSSNGSGPMSKDGLSTSGKSREATRIVFEPGQDLKRVVDLTGRTPRVETTYSRNFPVPAPVGTGPMVLPRMMPFLSGNIDRDALTTLQALYRAHCTSLIECLRFCREKAFFHQISSFQGTLTVPVQRILFAPKMAQWIERADTVLYQRLMNIVDFLLLQVMPGPVVDCISNIGNGLVAHLRKSLSSFPDHALNAKLGPATIYCNLVGQALRVNMTAHAAANSLSSAANRSAMYSDMLLWVDVRRIVEFLPKRAVDDFLQMCVTRVRKTIDPKEVDAEVEAGTIFGQTESDEEREAAEEEEVKDPTSSPLDVWSAFILDLPKLFPYASAKDLVNYTQMVLSAVTRDITMAQAESFGAWWVTKCWLDEYIMYLACTGSFLERYKGLPDMAGGDLFSSSDVEYSSETTTSDSKDEDVSVEMADQTLEPATQDGGAGGQAKTGLRAAAAAAAAAAALGDDSGIGIRTPEDEYRYEFDHGEQAEMDAPQTQ